MPNQEVISLVAKILAHATSPKPEEAAAALQSTYKRMDRDGVSFADLLTLPVQELYQDALVKLVDVLLAKEENLSPETRREVYAAYMSLIVMKFTPASTRHDEAREYTQRRADEEAKRKTGNENSSTQRKAGKELIRLNGKPVKLQNGFTFKWRNRAFSFSPAAFLRALAPTFGPGSLFALSLDNPGRCLQLLAASLLWGMGFAGVLILLASSVHAVTGTMPWIDVRIASAFTGLSALGTVWKGRALFQSGWFY